MWVRSVALVAILAAAAPVPGAAGSAPSVPAPLWRDASASLPPKEAPGNSMGAKAFDMDGDGDLDLVIAMEFRPNRLLLNDGRGTFTDASDRLPRTARDSEEIAIADIDSDGDPDIAVANEDDLRQELYINTGGGRFVDASHRLAGRIKANAVVAFDPDRDGDVDLFFGGDKVSALFVNDGRGGFTDASRERLPDTFGATQDVADGDIDGDGDVDLVLGNEDRNQIYLNQGNGRFTLAPASALARPAAPEETRDVELVDLDGDRELDLVFANVRLWNPRAEPGMRILLNDGRGTFTAPETAWTSGLERGVLSALPLPLPGQTRPGLVIAMMPTSLGGPQFDGTVEVLAPVSGGGLSVLAGAVPAGAGTAGMDVIAADFDQDGKADLFVSGRGGPDRLLLTAPAPAAPAVPPR